tara:strand:+ start:3176 stop:4126 length:951 start_codon:yes stop_codon:yes gene_type:complete
VGANPEYEMRDIDMNSKDAVKNERARITKLMDGYKYFETPRAPVDVEDYRTENSFDRDGYKKAKDDWREKYIKDREKLAEVARKLDQQNTYLCQESKKKEDEEAIKNGTFYNADELEVLNERQDRRNEQMAEASKKYYHKNKKKITLKRNIKKQQLELATMENKEVNKKLVKVSGVVKPLCLCGGPVNITVCKDIKKHSTLIKHQLFKSIIRLVHYKRKGLKLSNAVKYVNFVLEDAKRVEAVQHDDGSWSTTIRRNNKDNILYFNDQCVPYDESVAPMVRRPTHNKKDYTADYKLNIAILSRRIPAKKGRPANDP